MNFKNKVSIALLIAAGSISTAFADSRPNILWLFSDDHAFQAIGAYGDRFADMNLTPNLDSIATQGMRFDKCYVGNSICAPSRATLLTGKHSHKNGKIDNRGEFDHDQMQFQKLLRANGYQTAMIGKIHLRGNMQGFDYWEVLPGQGKYENPDFISEKGKTKYQGHSTDIITDRALNWLSNSRDKTKPFMAMVHYKAPHRNWLPAERFRKRFEKLVFPEPETLFDDYSTRGIAAYDQDMTIAKTMSNESDLKADRWEFRDKLLNKSGLSGKELVRVKYQEYMRDYLACIAGVDENVGRLLQYLKDNGLEKNTVVMYSSDQGFYLGEHGWFDKRFMYEESFRTPLLVKWPGVIKPGSVNKDLVQNIDFAETFLDMAGTAIPSDMQGESLVPIMKGDTPAGWRKSLYYHYYEYPAVHRVRRHEGVTTGRYKLIRFYGRDVPDGEEWELYDLQRDQQEVRNEYSNPQYAPIITQLKEELHDLRKKYDVVDIPQTVRKPKRKAEKSLAEKDGRHYM
ncbi:MAG: sulfatase family protein [Planctomycetota bacterium]|jgi:arylsulfatase A-like enzyme